MSYIESGNWNELPYQELRPGVERVMIGTGADDVSIQIGRIYSGNEKNPHTHDEFDQIVIILEGVCDFYVGDEVYHMTSGSWVTVPKGTKHYADVQESPVPVINLDIFTPARNEAVKSYQQFLKNV